MSRALLADVVAGITVAAYLIMVVPLALYRLFLSQMGGRIDQLAALVLHEMAQRDQRLAERPEDEADDEDVALLEFNIVDVFFLRGNTLVVIMDGDGEDPFGALLSDDILI